LLSLGPFPTQQQVAAVVAGVYACTIQKYVKDVFDKAQLVAAKWGVIVARQKKLEDFKQQQQAAVTAAKATVAALAAKQGSLEALKQANLAKAAALKLADLKLSVLKEAQANKAIASAPQKSSALLYVGIGTGVLALAGGAWWFLVRKKP
jgi:hypothetical protein